MQDKNEMLSLLSDLSIVGENQAVWRAKAKHMERMRKRLLAQLMIEHIGKPVNERDMRARADERYLTHLKGQEEAECKANKYHAQFETIKSEIEVKRSLNATARAEMRLTQ